MAARKQNYTVVGVFEDRDQADNAVNELRDAGFREDQIGVAMRQPDGSAGTVSDADSASDANESDAGSGAITGAIAGLGVGALAGLGVLAGVIPVIGPAIAAGTLGVIVSNAAAGAGIAGLIGALIGAGIPENEAEYYEGEFQAGRTIVTVKANGRSSEAIAILRANGAYDMSTKGAVENGVAGPHGAVDASVPVAAMLPVDAVAPVAAAESSTTSSAKGRKSRNAQTATPHAHAQTHAHREDIDTIEVKEERLHAEKQPVQTGEVRVRKEVRTETKTLEVPVEREEIVIERTPVNRRKTASSRDRGRDGADFNDLDNLRDGEEIRIPVREEQVNVVKDQVVIEEVKVGKRVVRDTQRVTGEIRKEEVKVEETGNVNVRGRKKADAPV